MDKMAAYLVTENIAFTYSNGTIKISNTQNLTPTQLQAIDVARQQAGLKVSNTLDIFA